MSQENQEFLGKIAAIVIYVRQENSNEWLKISNSDSVGAKYSLGNL